MKNCKNCNATIEDSEIFCKCCGTHQCTSDGTESSEEDKYAALEKELFGMDTKVDLKENGLSLTCNEDISQSFDTVCVNDDVKKSLLESTKKQDEGKNGDCILLGGQNASDKKNLALALAKETKRDLMVLDIKSLCSIYIGQTSANVRKAMDAFDEYLNNKQCKVILFVEQIDEYILSSGFNEQELVEELYYYIDMKLDRKKVTVVMTATNENFVNEEQPLITYAVKL